MENNIPDYLKVDLIAHSVHQSFHLQVEKKECIDCGNLCDCLPSDDDEWLCFDCFNCPPIHEMIATNN